MQITMMRVLGESGKEYSIDLNTAGDVRCSCPAYEHSDSTPAMCKHIRFALSKVKHESVVAAV